MARFRIGIRNGSLNPARIAGGLLTLGLALGLIGTQLAGALSAEGASPRITLSSTSGPAGSKVTVRGTGFPARDDGWVFWDGDHEGLPEVVTDAKGAFSTSFNVPEASAGRHEVKVVITGKTGRAPYTVTGSGKGERPGEQRPSDGEPKLKLSTSSGPVGTTVRVEGSGFSVRDDGWVFWDGENGGLPEVMTDGNGAFTTSFKVPDSSAGQHTVKVVISGETARVPFTVSGGSSKPQPQPEKPQSQPPAPAPRQPSTPPAPPPSSPAQMVWQADMETGNLGQWTAGSTRGGSYDSGDCERPSNGVTTEQARTGKYSMKMTIDTSNGQSGCRQFRHEESARGDEYYYSAWMLIPRQVNVSNFWNFFQFKSSNPSINETTWVIEAKNRPNGNLHAVLRWKGLVAGPHSGEGTALRYYDQAVKDIPIGKWFHVEFFLRQSESYGGRVTVWQDGVQLWDLNNVKTRYPNADQRWSINSYSDALSGHVGTVYVDDARISRTRAGPN